MGSRALSLWRNRHRYEPMTSHPHLFHHHRRNRTEDDQLWGDLHHNRRKHRAKLPVIPDLRFEYSYLRSISPYVQVERIRDDTASVSQYHHHSSVDDLLKDYDKLELHSSSGKVDIAEETGVVAQSPSPKEVIHVQWKKVLWITMRDQVISPLLQGALWYVQISPYFFPYLCL